MSRLMLWATLGLTIGVGFNVVWAIVFWDSGTGLWALHWLGLPLSLGVCTHGFLKELKP